jgi:hypothetical protein
MDTTRQKHHASAALTIGTRAHELDDSKAPNSIDILVTCHSHSIQKSFPMVHSHSKTKTVI